MFKSNIIKEWNYRMMSHLYNSIISNTILVFKMMLIPGQIQEVLGNAVFSYITDKRANVKGFCEYTEYL